LTDEEVIQAVASDLERENTRYYWTVYLSIGLMDFLERHPEYDMKLTSCGTRMKPAIDEDGNQKTEGDDEVGPKNDILLQDTKNLHGILIEIKTSYPEVEENLNFAVQEDIEQLKSFDRNVTGWKGADGKVSEYCIILMPYHEEAPRAAVARIQYYLDATDPENRLLFIHPFAIWYWQQLTSMKKLSLSKEILQIFPSGIGKNVGWKLGEYIEKHFLEIDLESLFRRFDREKYRFGREPPNNCIYTIEVIYFIFGGALRRGPDDQIICTLDEIMTLAEEYFPPWIPDETKTSQLQRKWVRDALVMLENIGMARRQADNRTYELAAPTKRNKDFSANLYWKVAEYLNKHGKRGAATPLRRTEEATTLRQF